MADFFIKGLVLILCIDIMFFLGQIAINNVAEDIGRAPLNFYNSSYVETTDSGNGSYVVDTSNLNTRIYTSNTGVTTEEGNVFTDTVNDLKNWFIENTPALNYAINFVGAPATFLNVVHAPKELSFAVGGLWFIMTIAIIVMIITGRNT